MSSTGDQHPAPQAPHSMQASLFALRDSLMNLKLSLLELAESSDIEAQQFALEETQQLLSRLRP
jgi:hypothetical protein